MRIDGQSIASDAKEVDAGTEKLGWEGAELGITVRLGEPDLLNMLEGCAAAPGNDGGGAPDESRGGTVVLPPACSKGVATTGAGAFDEGSVRIRYGGNIGGVCGRHAN